MGSKNITAIMGLFEAQKKELQAYRQQAMDGQITPAQWESLTNGALAATDSAVLGILDNLSRDDLSSIAAVFIFRHFEELQNGESNSKSIESYGQSIRHLGEIEAQKREASVKNGIKGGKAKAKNEKAAKIKAWAIEKSKNMRGSAKQISRNLAKIIPEEFNGKVALIDSETIIYRALLAEQKRHHGKV